MCLSLMCSPNGLWTQRSVKIVMTNFKMKLPTTRATVTPLLVSRFSLQKQLTQRVAAIVHENPASILQRASRLATQQLADTLLEHSDMDKMAVDNGGPKPATELTTHVLTIFHKSKERVAKRNVQCRDMAPRVAPVVCKRHGVLRHCPWLHC